MLLLFGWLVPNEIERAPRNSFDQAQTTNLAVRLAAPVLSLIRNNKIQNESQQQPTAQPGTTAPTAPDAAAGDRDTRLDIASTGPTSHAQQQQQQNQRQHSAFAPRLPVGILPQALGLGARQQQGAVRPDRGGGAAVLPGGPGLAARHPPQGREGLPAAQIGRPGRGAHVRLLQRRPVGRLLPRCAASVSGGGGK